MAIYSSVFSKYEMRKLGIKISGQTGAGATFKNADCVGTFEEELDVKVLTKMCRGVPSKVRPRGAGTGKITYTGHMPYDLYCAMFDMERNDLKAGVQGYGQNNFHKEFALVADVFDEDDKELLLAYPRCIIQTGPNTNIENGAEEVAEIEVEISVMPDTNGYCRYECVVEDLPQDSAITRNAWMGSWADTMVLEPQEA